MCLTACANWHLHLSLYETEKIMTVVSLFCRIWAKPRDFFGVKCHGRNLQSIVSCEKTLRRSVAFRFERENFVVNVCF